MRESSRPEKETTMNTIPELEKSPAGNKLSGSWIIVDRETGKVVLETFQRSVAQKVNQVRYEVRTAYQHLSSLNA